MIRITINNDQVEIDTVNPETNTTGCTELECDILLSIAESLCSKCVEGAK